MTAHENHKHRHSASCTPKNKVDYLLWGSLTGVVVFYLAHWLFSDLLTDITGLKVMAHTVFELVNTMWWGVFLGMVMLALLSKIPREFVMSVLGQGGGLNGILRATMGGMMLDLCNHGILMVGAKLYERGASAGQMVAFLIASPWNSFSLTLVLVALIGLYWTAAFVLFSLVIAIITGMVFEWLVKAGKLPANPNTFDLRKDFRFWPEAKSMLKDTRFSYDLLKELARNGLMESRMVMRWILFGVLLAALVRASVDTATFETYLGPTFLGLVFTVIVATILEVCSEGSTPIAADIFTRANAPGNSFTFLMTGVATDYTEIMIVKDTTKSWRIALYLPLISLPQVVLIGWLINQSTLGG